MRNRQNYKLHSRVSAFSLSGQKIIGNYRGSASGFGCWIFGIIAGSTEPPSMHKCARLSITLLDPPTKNISDSKVKLLTGQLCQALTLDGKQVTGQFMQTAGPKFAYVRGSDQVHKVRRDSLLTL